MEIRKPKGLGTVLIAALALAAFTAPAAQAYPPEGGQILAAGPDGVSMVVASAPAGEGVDWEAIGVGAAGGFALGLAAFGGALVAGRHVRSAKERLASP